MVKEGNQYLCLVMIIRKKYDIEYLFQNSSTPGRFLSFDRQKKKQIKNILLTTKNNHNQNSNENSRVDLSH